MRCFRVPIVLGSVWTVFQISSSSGTSTDYTLDSWLFWDQHVQYFRLLWDWCRAGVQIPQQSVRTVVNVPQLTKYPYSAVLGKILETFQFSSIIAQGLTSVAPSLQFPSFLCVSRSLPPFCPSCLNMRNKGDVVPPWAQSPNTFSYICRPVSECNCP